MTQFEKQIIRETVKQFKDAIKLLETMNAPPGLLDPYRLALTKAEGLLRRSRYRRTAVRMVSPRQQTFDSASAASKALRLSPSTLCMHLNHPDRYPDAKGYVFERVEDTAA